MPRILLCAAPLLLAATPAFADLPEKDWIGIPKVSELLAAKGYRMTEIEADDGHWEGEATRDGKSFDFQMDPRTGRIIKIEPDADEAGDQVRKR